MFDGFSSDELRKIVNEIKGSSIVDTAMKKEFYKDKYADFVVKFPRLFDAALEPSFPMSFLEFMLQQRDGLYQQDLNKATVEAADKFVYDKLRETYVTPVVKE